MKNASATSRVETALEAYASDDTNCSQAVATAYSDDLGIDRETARNIVQGLGGGIGGTGGVCGALTAAVCVVSARCAHAGLDKAGTYAKVREACGLFEERMGTMECAVILEGEVPRPLCCQRAVRIAAESIEAVSADLSCA